MTEGFAKNNRSIYLNLNRTKGKIKEEETHRL